MFIVKSLCNPKLDSFTRVPRYTKCCPCSQEVTTSKHVTHTFKKVCVNTNLQEGVMGTVTEGCTR